MAPKSKNVAKKKAARIARLAAIASAALSPSSASRTPEADSSIASGQSDPGEISSDEVVGQTTVASSLADRVLHSLSPRPRSKPARILAGAKVGACTKCTVHGCASPAVLPCDSCASCCTLHGAYLVCAVHGMTKAGATAMTGTTGADGLSSAHTRQLALNITAKDISIR